MFRPGGTAAKYFDVFDRIAEVVVRAAERFNTFLSHCENPARHADEITQYEREADEVTHHGLELLYQSFVTPLERGEISRLIRSLDDVIDLIEDAAKRFVLHGVTDVLPAAKELCGVLVDSARVAQRAVASLRTVQGKASLVRELGTEAMRLEHEGDRINHGALADLFKAAASPRAVLQWQQIIADIEAAIDRCRDVVNVVEDIALDTA